MLLFRMPSITVFLPFKKYASTTTEYQKVAPHVLVYGYSVTFFALTAYFLFFRAALDNKPILN